MYGARCSLALLTDLARRLGSSAGAGVTVRRREYSSSRRSKPLPLPSRFLMRTSRRIRTRQPWSATVLLSEVLSMSPGNFLALKTLKGCVLISILQSTPGGRSESAGSRSKSLGSLVVSYKLKERRK